jgi:hypothetical protein
VSTAVVEYLKTKGVEFDCEAENGFGWYWFVESSGQTDNKGYMSQDEAADGCCEALGITHLVIRGDPDVWGIQIICAGELPTCLNYMRSRKPGSVALMYPSGRLASYIL